MKKRAAFSTKEPEAQYIVDAHGHKTAVVLDIKTFEEILDILDDYYCGKAYDRAKKNTDAAVQRGDYETPASLKRKLDAMRKKKS